MGIRLHVLIVEDSEDDTLLLVRALQQGGYEPVFKRVETSDAMDRLLEQQEWDIVIADYSMPQFSAPKALELLKNKQMDIPFIIVSGAIDEEMAVSAMKAATPARTTGISRPMASAPTAATTAIWPARRVSGSRRA